MTSNVVKRKSKKEPKITERKLKRNQWFKNQQKQFLKKPQISLEDLSESDFDSNDELSVDDEEYGTLTDTEDESDEELDEVPEPEGSVGDSSDDEAPVKVKQRIPTEADARTIFVGNLPNNVSKIKVKKWFSKYGEVESVRLRCPPRADPSIPKKVAVIKKDFHEERSNILAYVCFVGKESAEKALEANGAAFDDKHHMRVDSSIKRESFDAKKAVFIGNLPFSAEEDQLREIFGECGDIESIRIVRDRKTCVGKGFGYVNFKERHSVTLALEHDGVTLGKRELRVKKADYKKPTRGEESKDLSKKKPTSLWEKKKAKFASPKERSQQRKTIFQGELSKKKEKRKNKRKTNLQKKKEVFKKILNTNNPKNFKKSKKSTV